jgi:hypothetical protein
VQIIVGISAFSVFPDTPKSYFSGALRAPGTKSLCAANWFADVVHHKK